MPYVWWEDTNPEPGVPVRVKAEPGCPGELAYHGIRPYVNGLEGWIEAIEPEHPKSGGHHYRVRFPESFHPDHPNITHQYFSLDELEPLRPSA